ncbi:MAG: MFS transporter, partial [Candidatus Hodarchaeales archaeon]
MPETYSTKNAYLLLFASQIINIGFGLLAIFITLLADEIDLQPIEIGWIISIFMVSRAISASFIPAISDRVGRRLILIIALFGYALTTTLLGFSRDFLSLFLLRILEGASAGAAFPTAEALLVDSVPSKDRGAWLGKYFTTFTFGFIIGPAVGGILFTFGTDFLNYSPLTAFIIPFVFTGMLGFLSLIFVILFVKDIQQKRSSDKEEITASDHGGLKTPYLPSFLTLGVLSGFAIGLIIPIFALYMTDVFLLTEGTIGFIFTISGSLALLVNYPAGKLSDKMNRMIIVSLGMMFAGLGFVGVAFSMSLTAIILFFILRQMAFQAYLPAYRAFQADKIPSQIRGKVMGRIQSAFNVGAVFGPLIGAATYEFYATKSLKIITLPLNGGAVPFLIAGILGISQVFI